MGLASRPQLPPLDVESVIMISPEHCLIKGTVMPVQLLYVCINDHDDQSEHGKHLSCETSGINHVLDSMTMATNLP